MPPGIGYPGQRQIRYDNGGVYLGAPPVSGGPAPPKPGLPQLPGFQPQDPNTPLMSSHSGVWLGPPPVSSFGPHPRYPVNTPQRPVGEGPLQFSHSGGGQFSPGFQSDQPQHGGGFQAPETAGAIPQTGGGFRAPDRGQQPQRAFPQPQYQQPYNPFYGGFGGGFGSPFGGGYGGGFQQSPFGGYGGGFGGGFQQHPLMFLLANLFGGGGFGGGFRQSPFGGGFGGGFPQTGGGLQANRSLYY